MGSEVPAEPFNTSSQPTSANRPKRKGQRRVGKKTEATPLAGMIDEISGVFDKPVSVREVLKRNRVDISLMVQMAWSPSACKELKRLCTRVSRKRQAKAKAPAASNDAPPDPSSGLGVLRLPPLFLPPQPGLVARLLSAVSRRPLLQLDSLGPSHSDGPVALLPRFLPFCLHPLQVCSLSGDGNIVLVGKVVAVGV